MIIRTKLAFALGSILALGPIVAMADAAEEVMAAARAQWAAQVAEESTEKIMATVADDYTEFNPNYPTRIDGKDHNMALAEAYDKDAGKLLAGDMSNAHVQVYGDVAILSYNFMGAAQDKDGAVSPIVAKSTRVYAKKKGKWMLVHANFAPLTVSDN